MRRHLAKQLFVELGLPVRVSGHFVEEVCGGVAAGLEGARVEGEHVACNLKTTGVFPRLGLNVAHAFHCLLKDPGVVFSRQELTAGQELLCSIAFLKVPVFHGCEGSVYPFWDEVDSQLAERVGEVWEVVLPECESCGTEEAVEVHSAFRLVFDKVAP